MAFDFCIARPIQFAVGLALNTYDDDDDGTMSWRVSADHRWQQTPQDDVGKQKCLKKLNNDWPHFLNSRRSKVIWTISCSNHDTTAMQTHTHKYINKPQPSITKVAEHLWYILSVCVCVWKLLTDLNQILWNDRSSAKDRSTKFWDYLDPGLDGYRISFSIYV